MRFIPISRHFSILGTCSSLNGTNHKTRFKLFFCYRLRFFFERSAEVISVSSKQIDVSFSCICPIIDHKFCHNIVIIANEPSRAKTRGWRGGSIIEPCVLRKKSRMLVR